MVGGSAVFGGVGGHNVQVQGDVHGDLITLSVNEVVAESEEPEGTDADAGTGTDTDTDDRLPPTAPQRGTGKRSRYRATIEKIYARCPSPVGREVEQAQVADFLSGNDPYFWWIGEPYSGKTTLAAAIAAAPQPDVVTVGFFVSRADGTRVRDFQAALADQLAAVAGLPRTPYSQPHGFDLNNLWPLAAERVRRTGRTLLLIVDGLDEDDYSRYREVSIASQLPESCPYGSRVLVTSRYAPDVLAAVGDSHPLRSTLAKRLRANDASNASRQRTEQELHRAFDDPDRATARANRAVMGLLAAAGGHLGASDLVQLAHFDADLYEVRQILEHTLGRLVEPRDEFGERRYVLAHDLIRAEAMELLGNETLRSHRAAIGAWADRFAADGWPAGTPTYLLDQYPRLLVEDGDHASLRRLQRPERYRLLYERFGSHHVAMSGLNDLIAMLASESDYTTLVPLVMWVGRLRNATEQLPADVPEGWALLGEFDKAAHLARGTSNDLNRVEALAAVARVYADVSPLGDIAQAGDPEELLEAAEFTAFRFPEAYNRASSAAMIARAYTSLGNSARALALIEHAYYPEEQWDNISSTRAVRALTDIAGTAAAAGGVGTALMALRRIPVSGRQEADEAAIRAAVHAGQLATAEQIANCSPARRVMGRALAALVEETGETETADRLIAELSNDAVSSHYRKRNYLAVLRMVESVVKEGRLDRARQLADSIGHSNLRAQACLFVAWGAVDRERYDLAVQVLAGCPVIGSQASSAWAKIGGRAKYAAAKGNWRQAAELLGKAWRAAWAEDSVEKELTGLVPQVIIARDVDGEPARAGQLIANTIERARSAPGARRDTRLAAVARMSAAVGMLPEAEKAIGWITSPDISDKAFVDVAEAVTGDLDLAERLIACVANPMLRMSAMRRLVNEAARARRFEDATRIAKAMPDHPWRAAAVAEAAGEAVSAGCLEDAETLLTDGSLARGWTFSAGLARVAKAWIQIGAHANAARLLWQAERHVEMAPRWNFLETTPMQLVTSFQAAGQYEQIEAVSPFIPSSWQMARAMIALVNPIRRPGDNVRNRRLLETAENAVAELDDPDDSAELMLRMTEVAIRAGDDEFAGRMAGRVLAFIRNQLTDDMERIRIALRLYRGFDSPGYDRQRDSALAAAQQLALEARTKAERGACQALICRSAIRLNMLDTAESVASSIAHQSWRAEALSVVAKAAWRSKDHRRARYLLKDAEAAARRIVSPTRKAITMTYIAMSAADFHDRKTARRLIRGAEAIVADIFRNDLKGVVLGRIAQAWLKLKDIARAQKSIEEIKDVLHDVSDVCIADAVMFGLVRDVAASGLIDDAKQIAQSVQVSYPRYYILAVIARYAAICGESDRAVALFEEAISAARRIRDPKVRDSAVAQVARRTVGAGYYDVAESCASYSPKVANAVTRGLIEAGRLEDAERVIESVIGADVAWQTLADLARAAYAADDCDRADRIVRRLISEGAPQVPLDVIVRLCPTAAAVITETLNDIHDQKVTMAGAVIEA